MTTTGGEKLKAAIRKGKAAASIEGVEVGFFPADTYPGQGTPVAEIADINEFGRGVPERPFFRRAVRNSEEDVRELVRANIDGVSGKPNLALAEMVGETVKSAVQREITALQDPPNAPSTIARKGSSNPLIDEGHMRASPRYRIAHR